MICEVDDKGITKKAGPLGLQKTTCASGAHFESDMCQCTILSASQSRLHGNAEAAILNPIRTNFVLF